MVVSILKRGTAEKFYVKRGDLIKIESIHGGQLADLTFHSYSQCLTIDHLRSVKLKRGDHVYDKYEKPVLNVMELHTDSMVNILFPGCRKEVYSNGRKGCRDLLAEVFEIPKEDLPPTINLFMDLKMTSSSFLTMKTCAKEGDYILFEALKSVEVGVSCCPCTRKICPRPGNIRIEVMKRTSVHSQTRHRLQ